MKRTPWPYRQAEVPRRLRYSRLRLDVLEDRLPPGDLLVGTTLGASLLGPGLLSQSSDLGGSADVRPSESPTSYWPALPATPAPPFRVSLGGSAETVEQLRTPTVVIPREEIASLVESPQGLVVRGRHAFLFVPKALEGYDGVRADLQHWGSIENQPSRVKQVIALQCAVGLIVLAAFAAVYLLENPYAVVPIGLTLSAFFVASFVVIQRYQHFDRKIKRAAYLVGFPLFGILAKVVYSVVRSAP